MDWTADIAAIGKWVKKYRWIGLVLLVGLFLLLFPETNADAPSGEAAITETAAVADDLQEQLGELLSHLEGAGRVRVLLTHATGRQTHYESTRDRRTGDSGEELRTETVILTGADRGERGLVQRIDPPTYLGAVVLCQGADSASVRLAIVDAVSAATGLGADKISVWKMK